MPDNIKPQKEALFNAGLAQLERIHNLKQSIHTAHLFKARQQLRDLLISFRNELEARMSTEQKKNADTYEQMISSKNVLYDKTLYYDLIHYWRFLCNCEQTLGMGMPDKPENESDEV